MEAINPNRTQNVQMHETLVKINFGPLDNGLFRLRGFSGLGNLLCTWGEAMLYAKKNSMRVIWPTWPQISVSAVKYNRTYFNIFKNNGNYLSLSKYYSLSLKNLSSGSKIISYGPKVPYNVNWENTEDQASDAIWLRNNLLSIISPKYLKRIQEIQTPAKFIGIHIRRGDFLNPVHHFKDGSGKNVNKSIELDWFVQAIQFVRSKLGELPVICISDAKEKELEAVLKLKNVQLQNEHPIVDLLVLSKATGFIASGSTFSQWISYLGQMDTWINSGHTWYSPDFLSYKLHLI